MAVRSSILATVVGMSLLSCTGYAMSVVEAVDHAQHHDAQYRAVQAQYQADQSTVRIARAALLPHLTALLGRQWQRTSMQGVANQSAWLNSWAVQLNQPIIDMPHLAAYQEAQQGRRASWYAWQAAKNELVSRVVSHYFAVVEARINLVALRLLKHSVYQHYLLARRGFDVGKNSIVDVLEAQTLLSDAAAQEIQARNRCLMTYTELVSIVGQALSVRPLRAHIQWPTLPLLSDFVDRARHASPLVSAAWFAHTASQARVTGAHAAHFPRLDLVLSRSYGENSVVAMTGPAATYATTVGVQLAVPIFAGGATSAAVDQAAAVSQLTWENYLAARRQAVLATTAAFTNYHSGRHQVDALIVAVLAAETQLQAAQLGYEVGQSTTIEVLDAQQRVFHMRQQLASARLNTLSAYLQLHIVSGAPDERSLAFLDQQFAPVVPAPSHPPVVGRRFLESRCQEGVAGSEGTPYRI